MTTRTNQMPRRINCEAIRTLHTLERTLRRHVKELMNVDCEDIEAAEAVVFAIESTEKALKNVGVTRRQINQA